jgi:hypothetical protein
VFFKKKRLKAQYIIGWEERCLGGEGKWSEMGLARPDCGWLRTIGFVRKDLSDFVPEGLTDRSQAIYCLVSVQKGNRPVGRGMIGSKGRFFDHCGNISGSAGSHRPSGTGRLFGHVPGNKLPGYDHLVPPGQRLSSPFGTTNRLSRRPERTISQLGTIRVVTEKGFRHSQERANIKGPARRLFGVARAGLGHDSPLRECVSAGRSLAPPSHAFG